MNTYEHFTYGAKPTLLTRAANGLIVGIAALVPVYCLWCLATVVTFSGA